MVRTQRQKQREFSKQQAGAGARDTGALDYNNVPIEIPEDDALGVHILIEKLGESKSLDAQNKAIQSRKGGIRKLLTEDTTSDFSKSISWLLYVHLHPQYLPARKYFDSIVETIIKRIENRVTNITCIRNTCMKVYNFLNTSETQFDTCSIEEVQMWTESFLAMASLDKEVYWLGNAAISIGGCVEEVPAECLFLRFVHAAFSLFQKCVSEIARSKGASLDVGVLTSAELMGWSACCGEIMRAVMIVFKPRRHLHIKADQLNQWFASVEPFMDSSLELVCSEFTYKDVITSTCNVLVSLQFLTRYCRMKGNLAALGSDPTMLGLQLSCLVCLCNDSLLSSVANGPLREPFYKRAVSLGVHPKIVEYAAKLSPLARCGFQRAYLSVYEDASIFYDVREIRVSKTLAPHIQLLIDYGKRDTVDSNMNAETSQSNVDTDTMSTCDTSSIMILGPIFSSVLESCNNPLPEIRLYGLQTFETWFNRVVPLVSGSFQVEGMGALASEMLGKMQILSKLLTTLWCHPVKQVNHIASTIYERVVEFVARISVMQKFDDQQNALLWRPFIAHALSQPAQHRGRYQAMTLLLPQVGPQVFMKASENLIGTLVQAIRLREVCSSCCAFVGALLRSLLSQSSGDNDDINQRSLWGPPIAQALCSNIHRMRINTADYLVPEMLSIDPQCGPYLISLIKKLSPDTCAHEYKLWGLVQVCLHARLRSLVGSQIIQPSEFAASEDFQKAADTCITISESRSACLSGDVELRLAALAMLTASQKLSLPIPAHEMSILQSTLRYSLKSAQSDHRQGIIRTVKALITRQSELARMSTRDANRHENRIRALERDAGDCGDDQTALAEINGKKADSRAQIETLKKNVASFESLCLWLNRELEDNLYPGVTSDREIMSLDIINCAIEILVPLEGSYFSSFCSKSLTKTLINLIMSTWDRTRAIAADLLMKFPLPLPGYETADEVNKLICWGIRLTGGSRQRESEAGALLLRTLFSIYCVKLGWTVSVLSTPSTMTLASTTQDSLAKSSLAFVSHHDAAADKVSEIAISESCLQFLHGLAQTFEHRLTKIEALFALVENIDNVDVAADDTETQVCQLCNGVILVLRLCLEQCSVSKLFVKRDMFSADLVGRWQDLIQYVLQLTTRSLESAMTIVAEAKSDVPFAPVQYTPGNAEVDTDSKSDVAVASGPVNASTFSMAATYVNTNSTMGATTLKGFEADPLENVSMQRTVVAAWLMVKESTSLLALLVEISPPQGPGSPPNSTDKSAVPESKVMRAKMGITKRNEGTGMHDLMHFLTVAEIKTVGSFVLDALGRLKHMGAIAEAHAALQRISECLLRHAEKSTELCRLPSVWLQETLARLDSDRQVFILRRSAGFASTFISLLRAEPSNCKPTLLPLAMNSLLRHIELGLHEDNVIEEVRETADGCASTSGDTTMRDHPECNSSNKWRSCVHAMNVVRLIVTDAALAANIDPFVSTATIFAVKGFKSSKWAVRNSAMMVFSSVVQRVVDNDKKESGGMKAATLTEFFQRFPDLFPFLLSELADITHFSIESPGGWPAGLRDVYTDQSADVSLQHPSLYPILLILSKLRAPTHLANADSSADGSTRKADISLFVPMVERCSKQKLQKIREVAARALRALTPVQEIPSRCAAILSCIQLESSRFSVSANEVHGRLMLVCELFEGFRRLLESIGDNRSDYAPVLTGLLDQCFPALLSLESTIKQARPCAPVQIKFLHILQSLYKIISTEEIAVVHKVERLLLGHSLGIVTGSITAHPKASAHFPYEALLWKEALAEVTRMKISSLIVRRSEEDPSSPLLDSITMGDLLGSTQHRVSEVREGVILGIQASCEAHTPSTLVHALASTDVCLMTHLTRWAFAEKEPQVAVSVMSVLSSISSAMRWIDLPAVEKSYLTSSCWQIVALIKSRQRGDDLPDADSISSGLQNGILPTTTAALALELLGWVCSGLLQHENEVPNTDKSRQAILHTWVSLLRVASDENEGPELREAAGRSIAKSQALDWAIRKAQKAEDSSQASKASKASMVADATVAVFESDMSKLACEICLTTIKLLQDDDECVREITNVAASTASRFCDVVVSVDYPPKIAIQGSSGTLLMHDNASASASSLGAMHAVEVYTLEKMAATLSSCIRWNVLACESSGVSTFAGLERVLNGWQALSLCSVIPEDEVANLEAGGHVVCDHHRINANYAKDSQLATKIFDAEQPNLYAESLSASAVVISAVCDVLKLLHENDSASVQKVYETIFSQGWEALQLLGMLISDSDDVKISWICGPTYEKDAFTFLFSSLDAVRKALSVLRRSPSSSPSSQQSVNIPTDLKFLCGKISTEMSSCSSRSLHPWIEWAVTDIAEMLHH